MPTQLRKPKLRRKDEMAVLAQLSQLVPLILFSDAVLPPLSPLVLGFRIVNQRGDGDGNGDGGEAYIALPAHILKPKSGNQIEVVVLAQLSHLSSLILASDAMLAQLF